VILCPLRIILKIQKYLLTFMSRLEKFGVKMNLEIDYASHGSYETLILMAVQVSLIKLYSAVSIALCFC